MGAARWHHLVRTESELLEVATPARLHHMQHPPQQLQDLCCMQNLQMPRAMQVLGQLE